MDKLLVSNVDAVIVSDLGVASLINIGGGAWSTAWNYSTEEGFAIANEAVNTLFAGFKFNKAFQVFLPTIPS